MRTQRLGKKRFDQVLDKYNYFGVLVAYICVLVLGFVLGSFTKFHISLILSNNTTLEHLDAKRSRTPRTREYDLGRYNNWISVFGKKKILWFLPVSGVPMVSDGIIWMKNDKNFKSAVLSTENRAY